MYQHLFTAAVVGMEGSSAGSCIAEALTRHFALIVMTLGVTMGLLL